MFSLPRSRFAISGALVAFVAAFLAIPAAQASAEIIVNLAGPGSGTVTSSPAGINCSNVGGGAPGPTCSSQYPNFTIVEMTAAPGPGFNLSGWKADDPFGGAFPGTSCNSGSANPCKVVSKTATTVHVTATFGCVPPILAPAVTTGEASAGQDPLTRTLEGTVNPNVCGLEEAYFEYGTTTEYGSTTATEPEPAGIGKGSTPVPVSAETDFLQPDSTYHYRLVAVGPGGTSKGEDQTFTTGAAPGDECPNALIRAEQGVTVQHLPACMALEMVSPPRKLGQPAKFPNVSADGSRVTYFSATALGEDPPGLFPTTIYVAGRGGSGWTSESTIPDRGFPYLWESVLRPSFSPDFSRWFGIGMTEAQVPLGVGQVYEGGLDGFFRPLSEPLVPLSFSVSKVPLEVIGSSVFQGASADRSHLYFRAGNQATYFPGDPSPGGPGAEPPANLYLARSDAGGELALDLLQRDRTGKVWGGNCGARLGGIGSVQGSPPPPAANGERNQGAVSADGSRTYFSARASQPPSGNCEESSKLRILERLETPAGPQIVPLFSSECSRPSLPDPPGACKELSGDDLYQGASLDQSKVYFTTNRQLANSDLDGSNAECSVLSAVAGCDLYLYDRSRPAGERLVQVSAGGASDPTPGEGAKVYNGITAISADGSHVYFVAQGVLTGANAELKSPTAGQPNLYLWDAGSEETAFLGTLDPGDAISTDAGNGLWGGQGTWRNNAYPVPVLSPAEQGGERGEEGGDGHILVFESRAELTPNDADGHHLDVYHYDAAGPSLQCLSCASEPDAAPLDVENRSERKPPGTDFAESRRWVSEDGEEVGFVTPEGLRPGDVNGAIDGYLWRQGSLVRLPGTPFGDAQAAGPFLSHDGSTVAFATATPLLPQDGDTAADVYVARVGGGYPNPPAPNPCEPGNPSRECQEGQASPPAPQAGSEAAGSGNPRVPPPCRKGKVRRHGRCVPRHRHRHANKRRHTRQTDTHRRAGK